MIFAWSPLVLPLSVLVKVIVKFSTARGMQTSTARRVVVVKGGTAIGSVRVEPGAD